MALVLEIWGRERFSSMSLALEVSVPAAALVCLASHWPTRASAVRKASWKDWELGRTSLKKARPK